MTGFRESRISAHHNYLVNDMLTPGFLVGDPQSSSDFYLLADPILPGESTSRISARLFDGAGGWLVDLQWNRILAERGECVYQSIPGGFRILLTSGDLLLEVHTQSFANGHLTRLKGRAHDHCGEPIMESFGDSIRIPQEKLTLLYTPFSGV
jgi:hypothetical protein